MARTIKNIGIVYRPQSTRAYQTAKEVARWLVGKKLKLFLHPDLKALTGVKRITKESQIDDLELVIVLGGDGTFLAAVRMLGTRQVPILGINLGNLGFLTETKPEELYDVIDLALAQKMERIERSTLNATLVRKNGKRETWHALNDIVVERGPTSRIIDMSIHAGPFLVSTVKADGLILSTPTGSTAYSLASGGPVVQPGVRAITMTPICPHTLTNRPVILSDEQTLKLKLAPDPGRATMIIDGQNRGPLTDDDLLLVTRGKKPVIMLSLPTRNYFDILRAKLRFGERE